MHKAKEVIRLAVNAAIGTYGKSEYRGGNGWQYNVGKWANNKWHSDCLGFVHIMANPDHLFSNDKRMIGGGATMNKFVLSSTEQVTLDSYCNIKGSFPKADLKPAALLQTPSHVGLYVGNICKDGKYYNTAECASAPADNAGWRLSWTDLSTGKKYKCKGGTYYSQWTSWGYFEHIDYTEEEFDMNTIPTVRYGSDGGYVETCQALLNAKMNAGLVVDGVCGDYTITAIKKWQKKYGLQVDGECGAYTWKDLITREV